VDELIIDARGHARRPGQGAPLPMPYAWLTTQPDGRVSRLGDCVDRRPAGVSKWGRPFTGLESESP
jgi:hypothetical protein